jgi:hypothetical protein
MHDSASWWSIQKLSPLTFLHNSNKYITLSTKKPANKSFPIQCRRINLTITNNVSFQLTLPVHIYRVFQQQHVSRDINHGKLELHSIQPFLT